MFVINLNSQIFSMNIDIIFFILCLDRSDTYGYVTEFAYSLLGYFTLTYRKFDVLQTLKHVKNVCFMFN